MGVVVRKYVDILTKINNFLFSTCISSFFGSSIPTSLFILKSFFGLKYYMPPVERTTVYACIIYICLPRPEG